MAGLQSQLTKHLAAVDMKKFNTLDKKLTLPADLEEAHRDTALNRYPDILPNPLTRVPLKAINGIPASEYINANFLRDVSGKRLKYIAAQGPLPNTTDAFVRMLWEQEVPVVVMVTNLYEKGKAKCARYFPSKEKESLIFGDVTVTLVSSKLVAGFLCNALHLQRGKEVRKLMHFWYTTWPDHGVPAQKDGKIFTRDVNYMLQEVRLYMAECNTVKPIVVHCSAGVGRSGAIIAIDCGMDAIESNRYVDLLEVIQQLRQDRMAMVQHASQYHFACYAVAQFTINRLKRLADTHACIAAVAAITPEDQSVVEPVVTKPKHQPPDVPTPTYVTNCSFDNPDNTPEVLVFQPDQAVIILQKTDVWWRACVYGQEGWILPEYISIKAKMKPPSASVNPFFATAANDMGAGGNPFTDTNQESDNIYITTQEFSNPDATADLLVYKVGFIHYYQPALWIWLVAVGFCWGLMFRPYLCCSFLGARVFEASA